MLVTLLVTWSPDLRSELPVDQSDQNKPSPEWPAGHVTTETTEGARVVIDPERGVPQVYDTDGQRVDLGDDPDGDIAGYDGPVGRPGGYCPAGAADGGRPGDLPPHVVGGLSGCPECGQWHASVDAALDMKYPPGSPQYDVERWLQHLIVTADSGRETDVVRREIIGYLGQVGAPAGTQRAQREFSWADIHVDGAGNATVRVLRARVESGLAPENWYTEVAIPLIDARAYVLAADAIQKASRFVTEAYEQVMAEQHHQIMELLAGRDPVHPAHRAQEQRPSEAYFAAEHGGTAKPSMEAAWAGLHGAENAKWLQEEAATHAAAAAMGQPPVAEQCEIVGHLMPGPVAVYSIRPCARCGERLRLYPANVTEQGEPEWRPVA